MYIVGREQEKYELQRLLKSNQSEFLAVYGRRRVGKTFLIREYFNNKFTFYTPIIKNYTLYAKWTLE